MRPVGPISVVGLFPGLRSRLLELLRGLAPEDWNRPTACRGWTVHDIAAHLLDGDLRKLSLGRDRRALTPGQPIESYRDLVAFLNQLNAEWVAATRRLSPRVLADLLDFAGGQVEDYLRSLDPMAPAAFPVSWAGEDVSSNWFDIAREYTERWHHQQQIRDAVGAPSLTDRQYLHPVLDTFLRALPHAYRETTAPEGATIAVHITGEAGGGWALLRKNDVWQLCHGAPTEPAAAVTLDQDAAWRLFAKGIEPAAALARAGVHGPEELTRPFFGALAVMA